LLPERIVPECGVRVGKSALLASDRGEFGGELVFADETGRARLLLHDNIRFLHAMPHGIVAVGGLAHMGIRYGSVYHVDFGWNGKPLVKLWKNLPQPPGDIRVLENGSVLIRTDGNDDVILTVADDARLAARATIMQLLEQLVPGALAIGAIAILVLLFKRVPRARRSSHRFPSPPSC
jgi:hypothetical protein